MNEEGKRVAEAEAPAEPSDAKKPTREPGPSRLRKVRVAVVHGYRGSGYSGNTRSGSAKVVTIDDEFEKALCAAGAITEENTGGLEKKLGWNRCARTDKGVSALVNVFSAKLLLSDAELQEPEHASWVARVNQHLPPHVRVWTVARVKASFTSKREVDSRTYEYVMPAFLLCPRDADAATWAFDDAARMALNSALLYFVGSNKYHNYTKSKAFHDPEVVRMITQVAARRVVVLNGTPFVVFRIRGTSFMLHQIRKMMAMAISLCRHSQLTNAKRVIGGSFCDVDVNIVKAPAVGLFLREPHFDQYNAEWGTGDSRDPVRLTPAMQTQVDAFAEDFVWPEIASSAAEFREWLASLDAFPMSFGHMMEAYDAMDAARAERLARMGPRVNIQAM